MAKKEIVSVGIANAGTKNLDVEVVKTWTPTDVSKSKEIVYFKADGIFYSMKREDYVKIFN